MKRMAVIFSFFLLITQAIPPGPNAGFLLERASMEGNPDAVYICYAPWIFTTIKPELREYWEYSDSKMPHHFHQNNEIKLPNGSNLSLRFSYWSEQYFDSTNNADTFPHEAIKIIGTPPYKFETSALGVNGGIYKKGIIRLVGTVNTAFGPIYLRYYLYAKNEKDQNDFEEILGNIKFPKDDDEKYRILPTNDGYILDKGNMEQENGDIFLDIYSGIFTRIPPNMIDAIIPSIFDNDNNIKLENGSWVVISFYHYLPPEPATEFISYKAVSKAPFRSEYSSIDKDNGSLYKEGIIRLPDTYFILYYYLAVNENDKNDFDNIINNIKIANNDQLLKELETRHRNEKYPNEIKKYKRMINNLKKRMKNEI